MEPIQNTEEGLNLLMTSKKSYAVVSGRLTFEYLHWIYGHEAFYIPPANIDSAISHVLVATPISPKFKYRKQFDDL